MNKKIEKINRYGNKQYNWDVENGFLKKKDWNEINVSFIVSTGRTGTKFLADLFNRAAKTTSLHEPEPSFFELANEFSKEKIHLTKLQMNSHLPGSM